MKSTNPIRRPASPTSNGTTGGRSSAEPRPGAKDLMGALRHGFNVAHNRSTESVQRAGAESNRAFAARRIALEQQQQRIWREGDVYAPHDLSAVEQMKAKAAKSSRSRDAKPLNTRRGGGKDVLDDLAINPLKEYKNFSMLSEFTTEMGRIRHARDTGFRSVNQRKMAKAVRRARGLGLLPSVHRHPELHPERYQMRHWDLPRGNQMFQH